MPPVSDMYARITKRNSRDLGIVVPLQTEERRQSRSPSLSSLFITEASYMRQKSRSVFQAQAWTDDFVTNNEPRRSERLDKSKKLADLFDYDRILLDEQKEFYFRLDNVPKPSGKLEEYRIIEKLGCGQFGKVYLVQDYMDKKHYAMKAISKSVILRNHLRTDVEAERDYLYATNSPFIVSLTQHFEDEQRVYFVLDFVSGGDIYDQLRTAGAFSEELTRFYTGQVVLALEYLHNVALIYRDLKPENVMIDSHGYIKLVDLGFVKRVTTRTSTMVGTPAYMAPEMILHKPYDKGIDWWALGILVYEMLAGIQNTPFADPDRMAMFEKIATKEVTFPNRFPHTPVRDLIKRLLKVNPGLRLGSGQNGSKDVKNHPWFSSMKWAELYRRTMKPPAKPKVHSSPKTRVAALRQNLLGMVPRPVDNRTKFLEIQKMLKL